jgi:hypothetical protein
MWEVSSCETRLASGHCEDPSLENKARNAQMGGCALHRNLGNHQVQKLQ